MTDLVEAGRRYMAAGLSILALTGKSPNGAFHKPGQTPAWGPFVASPTDAWTKAARHRDTSGIGLVIPPHLVVVDIDGEEGAVSFQRLIGSTVPETGIAQTGRGLHLWFVSTQVIGNMKLAEKLDLKGHGGYVVGPPSVHPDLGTRYEWLSDLVIDLPGPTVHVDWLPDALEEVIAARSQVFRLPRATTSGSLKGLVDHMKRQGSGNRSNALYWAACTARDGGHSFEETLDALVPAIVSAGLTPREATRTVRSAYGV